MEETPWYKIVKKGNDVMSMNGYDISNYQKSISIANVACDFVIIKATQGISYYSPSFEKQIKEALSLNKLVGVYHYVDGSDYKGEVNFFLSKIKPYIGKVLICIDWESDMNKMWGNGDYITKLLDYEYKTTGIKPILYMSKSVCRLSYWTTVPENYETWIAQYANDKPVTSYNPKPWTDDKGYGKFKNPIIYQYTSKGNLPGYSGNLDLDICYLDKNGWIKRCKKSGNNVKNTYTVTVNTLNIREKADASSKDIGDLKNGSVITVDKIENGFAHFEGWCSTKYLS